MKKLNSFKEYLSSINEEIDDETGIEEPNLDSIDIVNLPKELSETQFEVDTQLSTHFFLKFNTDPELFARVSYLTKDGEEAANLRPIKKSEIDFNKAKIQSFYIENGDEYEHVDFEDVNQFV